MPAKQLPHVLSGMVLGLMIKYPLHFVDVETTALDTKRGELLSIAIITESKAGERSSYYQLIKPTHIQTAQTKALQVARYDARLWEGAPTFDAIAPLVAEFLKEGTIVAHNAQFDHAHITAALARCMVSKPKITRHTICTMQLMKEHAPTSSASLKSARLLFGLGALIPHDALDDARACRVVFKRLWRCSAISRMWLRVLHTLQKHEIANAQRRWQ